LSFFQTAIQIDVKGHLFCFWFAFSYWSYTSSYCIAIAKEWNQPEEETLERSWV
jgi:hypothetical protein